MTETERIDKDESPKYAAPTIADYGDLVELTAAGATGGHADGTFAYGQPVTFLSTAP